MTNTSAHPVSIHRVDAFGVPSRYLARLTAVSSRSPLSTDLALGLRDLAAEGRRSLSTDGGPGRRLVQVKLEDHVGQGEELRVLSVAMRHAVGIDGCTWM